jgi:DNA-binding Lrp family transcriptional regulator
MAKERKYTVTLTNEERKLCQKAAKQTTSTVVRSRYLILIAADSNHAKKSLTYEDIANKTGTTVPTVINTLKRFCTGGILEATVTKRNPKSDSARLKVDGELEARIVAKACTKPPDGYSRWTLDMLEEAICIILQENPSFNVDSVDRSTIGRALKRNDLRPHVTDYWCIPPEEDAEFVANMEDILDIYQTPFDPKRPLWCMDEKPYQLLDEVRQPLPMRPGDPTKVDSEYVRDGTCSVFCFIQPHHGTIHAEVEETRTAVDWANKIKYLVDTIEPDAEKIVLVMDNLNVHSISSLYKAFPPEEARRIAKKLEVHYTPKHGSWLDIAEIAINIITRECLNRRIPGIEKLREEVTAWLTKYNQNPTSINWQFTTEKARIKLKRLYPNIDKAYEARDKRAMEKYKKVEKTEATDEEKQE